MRERTRSGELGGRVGMKRGLERLQVKLVRNDCVREEQRSNEQWRKRPEY